MSLTVKELAKEFKDKFEYLGEDTETYINFSVSIEEELAKGKKITHKLKFIDSFRFMSSKLSNLINNLSETYSNEYKGSKERKKVKSVYDFIGLKNNKLHHKCNGWKKRWSKSLDGLLKKFPKTYEFCNNDFNKFILSLKKGVYPYEYMDSLERFDETSMPDKIAFYRQQILIWQILICYWWLKKNLEVEYVMQYVGMQKQIIGISKITMNHNELQDIESSYLMCLDANNFCAWEMSQKFPVNGFTWKKTLINLMKSS